MTFCRFDAILGSILERVKEFIVTPDLTRGFDATERLLAVLSQCQNTPSISSLDLEWPTRNVTSLKAVLSNLPSLKTLRMPLKVDFIELLSDWTSLEHVEGLRYVFPMHSNFSQKWIE
jgi:hypothetical protein